MLLLFQLLGAVAAGGAHGADGIPSMALFPPHRVSSLTPVELWVALPPSACTANCHVAVNIHSATGALKSNRTYPVTCTAAWGRIRAAALNLSAFPTGRLTVVAEVIASGTSDDQRVVLSRRSWGYEVVHSGVRSTRLLDGAFVDIVHWSGSEGAPFNDALRRMAPEHWAGQVIWLLGWISPQAARTR